MKKWLQKYLGINNELEQQRYIATQAQLAQITRAVKELTDSFNTLTESTEKLAKISQTHAEAIVALKTKDNTEVLDKVKEQVEKNKKACEKVSTIQAEIDGIKEAYEYHTKEIFEIKKKIDLKA